MVLTLGIDVGTQGTKVIAYDCDDGRQICQASVKYGIMETTVPERAEQEPQVWVDACFSAITQVLKSVDPKDVKAVAVSGQQHGLVPLDSDGRVIRPAKLWCDVESAKEANELSKKLGWTIVPGFTAPKILWLKHNEPENYAQMERVLLPHDYINYVLTGEYAMECGDASGTGLLGADRNWDVKALHAIDEKLANMLPRLIGPGDAVGTLLGDVASALGLSDDVVVGPGSGDNMMSALGAGAVTEGVVVLSLGTSGTLFGCSSTPFLDPSGCVAPFCDATGNWLPLLCTMSCTGALEEVRECFQSTHQELTKLAEKESPGCDGVNFLPYLSGERTPNWPHSSGSILGLSPGSMRPGLLYRAAMEGATFTLLAGLRRMQEMGFKPQELRVVGGGSKNELWRRIIADAFQIPLVFPKEPESAALGAALQAGAIYHKIPTDEFVRQQGVPLEDTVLVPNPEVKDLYNNAFERHCRLGSSLFEN
ncbi:hypothetical protein BSKO_01810 [Bryopsis sp. KO-2023]|nr:hypothetical protein BSKO_01810 [Bryopsis sp. KO-2023]